MRYLGTTGCLAWMVGLCLGAGHVDAWSLSAPRGQWEAAQALKQIRVEPKAGEVQVVIEADGVLEHRIYHLEEQSQIVLDIMNVHNSLKDTKPEEPNPLLERVRCQELPMSAYVPGEREKTFGRFILDLKRTVRYWIRAEPGRLVVGIYPPERGAPGNDGSQQESLDSNRPLPEADDGTTSIAERYRIEPAGIDPALFFGPPAASDDYRMGPEDVLEVNVFELEQLNRTVRVMADGTIDLPLVGSVDVLRLTSTEVAERVAGKLKNRYVQNPQVSVMIKEFHSQKVSLLGAVSKPATYPLAGRRSLLQLLADAGGLSADAGSVLYVFRQLTDGRSARLSVPLSELLVEGDPLWNILLASGDIVSVPPENALSVSVLGAVRSPGIYKLPVGEGASLLRAIARAGGLTERASKSGIQVKRREEAGQENILKVDLGKVLSGEEPDVILREGDVIVIKESFF